jgi:hypothetical protein
MRPENDHVFNPLLFPICLLFLYLANRSLEPIVITIMIIMSPQAIKTNPKTNICLLHRREGPLTQQQQQQQQ